jgi:hypothetical protein
VKEILVLVRRRKLEIGWQFRILTGEAELARHSVDEIALHPQDHFSVGGLSIVTRRLTGRDAKRTSFECKMLFRLPNGQDFQGLPGSRSKRPVSRSFRQKSTGRAGRRDRSVARDHDAIRRRF